MYIAAEKYVAAQSIPAVDPSTNLLTIDQYLGESSADGRQGSFDHSKWDALLKAHVKEGRDFGVVRGSSAVDYTALAADSRFREYLSELAGADVEALMPTEQLALFLNAYNALCVSVIVGALGASTEAHTAAHTAAHTTARAAARDGSQGPTTQASPLSSINDLTTTEHGPVWDQVAGVVGGRPYTLNEIEHRELRGKWGEPTIHSCIVCASASCPDLRPGAFCGEPAMLRAAMDEQFRGWMANPTKGIRLDKTADGGGVVYLSRIFLWFAADFGGERWPWPWWLNGAGSGPVLAFAGQYACAEDAAFIAAAAGRLQVRFLEYAGQLHRAV
jgi:hypothetical protein